MSALTGLSLPSFVSSLTRLSLMRFMSALTGLSFFNREDARRLNFTKYIIVNLPKPPQSPSKRNLQLPQAIAGFQEVITT